MAEEEDDDMSEMTGTDEGTESGTEGEDSEGGSSKTAEVRIPPPTELHNSALFMAKYLDQKLDKLFAATEKINVDIVEMEKRIMADISTKMQANHEALTVRITALENLTLEHGVKLQQQESKGAQQAHQLDDLQNQVGVITFRLH
ncbi:hypothetical protein MPTK1_2g26230 [Marchantia polymorpha subsp. ruderalis]|uniref:Uncharacterized protein n=1 Tax=Marchantia polymorpha TaxID=3197 RepID=A0A2R6XB95_MARPO|nr:hypothetical protein MARPO_0025s0061 [Marchantia polymorpha]BBN03767.1 hypothetical protein Mp_2g26230 [Marchantia polymorpha subsp. ruderalis]|eukprot:PTQ43368.1 hypothetical protein MARPO_0025s0061 [Marchantia polymorpha]